MNRYVSEPMDPTRRCLLRLALIGGTLAASGAAGLLAPSRALAKRTADAFAARSQTDVLAALFGTTQATPSEQISIEAPVQGTSESVPLTVSAQLGDVELIAIVTGANAHPLCATLATRGANPYLRTRIRMARTEAVTAYVKAGGRLYSASRQVKITAGGYGTGGR
jgi:sulfur-oxidizing protein SoxY